MSTKTIALTTAPTWETITAAHQRIASRIHRTPVLRSATLDALSGAELFFKCENLQKTGSFKIRGATNAIFSLSAEEAGRGREAEAKERVVDGVRRPTHEVQVSVGGRASALALVEESHGVTAF